MFEIISFWQCSKYGMHTFFRTISFKSSPYNFKLLLNRIEVESSMILERNRTTISGAGSFAYLVIIFLSIWSIFSRNKWSGCRIFLHKIEKYSWQKIPPTFKTRSPTSTALQFSRSSLDPASTTKLGPGKWYLKIIFFNN